MIHVYNRGEQDTAVSVNGVTLIRGASSGARLEYLLTLPAKEPEAGVAAVRPPLIVFLHSLEERGAPLDLLIENPGGQGLGLAGYALAHRDLPFATLSPLCPPGGYWTFLHRRLAALIRETAAAYDLDERRIFLTGVSMGGIGTWSLGMAEPGLFRALAPMAGAVYTPPMIPRYRVLRDLPVRAYHDRNDPSIPFRLAERSIARLNAAGGNGELIAFDEGEHYVHRAAFEEGGVFRWMGEL